MSRSLSIECDWLDQPAAADPVERRTWAGLRIKVAGRLASRLWDREAASERQTLYVPAFPLAEWLIVNWWNFVWCRCCYHENKYRQFRSRYYQS